MRDGRLRVSSRVDERRSVWLGAGAVLVLMPEVDALLFDKGCEAPIKVSSGIVEDCRWWIHRDGYGEVDGSVGRELIVGGGRWRLCRTPFHSGMNDLK